jgi:hypothetical protein
MIQRSAGATTKTTRTTTILHRMKIVCKNFERKNVET